LRYRHLLPVLFPPFRGRGSNSFQQGPPLNREFLRPRMIGSWWIPRHMFVSFHASAASGESMTLRPRISLIGERSSSPYLRGRVLRSCRTPWNALRSFPPSRLIFPFWRRQFCCSPSPGVTQAIPPLLCPPQGIPPTGCPFLLCFSVWYPTTPPAIHPSLCCTPWQLTRIVSPSSPRMPSPFPSSPFFPVPSPAVMMPFTFHVRVSGHSLFFQRRLILESLGNVFAL